jgi:DNA-binding winged helix-turn-helix (wHTH) protein
MAPAVYQIGSFRLDCGRFELLRNNWRVRLERKPLELLILLVECKDRLVTREEVAQRLWPSGIFVDTEHGINTAVRKLRQALRDDSDDPEFIQTVTGMGFRFVAQVVLLNPEVVVADFESAGREPRWFRHNLWIGLGIAIPSVLLVASSLSSLSLFHRNKPR